MQVGMRVDLELADGSKACGVFIHKKLSDSAGYACISLVDAGITCCSMTITKRKILCIICWHAHDMPATNHVVHLEKRLLGGESHATVYAGFDFQQS